MLLRGLIPQKLINYFKHFPLSLAATIFYGYPAKQLTVIGITGTDGKTTTSTMVYQILKNAGFKVGLISTVTAIIGDKKLSTGLHVTSPNPWLLQKILRKMVQESFTHVVIEVTSHGLDQFRLLGCNFKIGVLTNITYEHLDYHKNYINYLKSKSRLFSKTEVNIINSDDSSFNILKKMIKKRIITYGLNSGDYNLKNFPIKLSIIGQYNLSNGLAAAVVGKTLNISDKSIRKSLLDFKGVKGRMEEIKTGKNYRVFVDFAHTPNGLKNALRTLKALPHKRIIAVFGCAGLRDKKKRPLMGGIACQLANVVVLTAEDPRIEDINSIINEIMTGCRNKDKVLRIPDRSEAINFALNSLAKSGDIVGIFGKGHEQSMCFGAKEYPWSDFKAVTKAINKRGN